MLKLIGDSTLALALATGGITIIIALIRGIAEQRRAQELKPVELGVGV